MNTLRWNSFWTHLGDMLYVSCLVRRIFDIVGELSTRNIDIVNICAVYDARLATGCIIEVKNELVTFSGDAQDCGKQRKQYAYNNLMTDDLSL